MDTVRRGVFVEPDGLTRRVKIVIIIDINRFRITNSMSFVLCLVEPPVPGTAGTYTGWLDETSNGPGNSRLASAAAF
jgi:hypothetical protein